jgi:hypothetical protein
MWGGHPDPPPLTWLFFLVLSTQKTPNRTDLKPADHTIRHAPQFDLLLKAA